MGHFDEVEIRTTFEGRWVDGFEVAGIEFGADDQATFVVRRQSDGAVLPGVFAADRIRPANSAPAIVD